MDELLAYIRRRLHLEDAEVQQRPDLSGARPDLMLSQGDTTWIIEVQAGQVRQEALGRLALYRDLFDGDCTPLLVAPAVPRNIQAMARAASIEILQVPFEVLPSEGRSDVPLTSERSWRVVAHILAHEGAGAIDELARACGVSVGWVHRVVRSLADRGFIERSRGRIRLVAEERLLDAIGLERSLNDVEVARIETGYDDWDGLIQLLQGQLTDLPDQPVTWGLGGTSAAANWTGYEVRHNRLDVYAPESALTRMFDDASGGIPIHVLRPDRDLRIRRVNELQTIGLEETLLDALGLGFGQRDVALEVLRRMRR